jgi:hypothetical protein
MRRVVVLIAAAGVLASSCQRTGVQWPPAIQMLPSPAGDQSSEPQLRATAAGVVLSWIERHDQMTMLKYSERNGADWSTARTAAAGNDWFVSYADRRVPAGSCPS